MVKPLFLLFCFNNGWGVIMLFFYSSSQYPFLFDLQHSVELVIEYYRYRRLKQVLRKDHRCCKKIHGNLIFDNLYLLCTYVGRDRYCERRRCYSQFSRPNFDDSKVIFIVSQTQ